MTTKNLDDFASFQNIDKQDMLSHIADLPEQLQTAWELGLQQDLPTRIDFRQILIAGMGGSAIGADLLASYVEDKCSIPIFVWRDYNLPAWAKGPETLVIASSHSGNTEETLSAIDTALSRNCTCLAISTGGKLAKIAQEAQIPLWRFEHHGQPRAAVGYSFGLLLSLLTQLDLIPDPQNELMEAISIMQVQQGRINPKVPLSDNLAKRLAGQMMDRWLVVIASGILAPVARRWKGQISEIAKTWAQFEFLPEANHNSLAGINQPENFLSQTMALFLRSKNNHPRNILRGELTKKAFMLEGMGTDFVDALGESSLANMWSCLHLGDYVTYYLAMLYGVDPTPVEAIEGFKKELQIRE
jgi:glucose/mannose-6-phosphate isomerase